MCLFGQRLLRYPGSRETSTKDTMFIYCSTMSSVVVVVPGVMLFVD